MKDQKEQDKHNWKYLLARMEETGKVIHGL